MKKVTFLFLLIILSGFTYSQHLYNHTFPEIYDSDD